MPASFSAATNSSVVSCNASTSTRWSRTASTIACGSACPLYTFAVITRAYRSAVFACPAATAAVASAGNWTCGTKNGYCHQTSRPMQATATNATIQRREISANSSASTAATTNHGVADTITGTYGNACNCSGSARATTPTTATSAHNPDRMRSTVWRLRRFGFGRRADAVLDMIPPLERYRPPTLTGDTPPTPSSPRIIPVPSRVRRPPRRRHPATTFPARTQGGPLPSWNAPGFQRVDEIGHVGLLAMAVTAINGGAPSWAAIRPRVARRLAHHVTVMRLAAALMFTAEIL